ncbi:MobA/MobL family protein (plasmid) [Pseudochrobactrum algeriensis]|uniref:MobQ family relaxase n=1 Tax=Pseudochrobactrum algeriensis TaxID=2834768 RepID=UPI001BCBD7A3|nr:MobQ family relaxase [Pseudochrobactrum algeriensis]QVQ38612.1 MobA/MobL family protein [Pseudochrobactrum algeriensis]QVQ38743.1 MobA/MobL family protein [Pseudochrobactrum algeriensis]QVQ42286.1 MobA/MobL family protein [Pseudochrobactrum algeriensis]
MAIYHLSAKVISRAGGRSSVAAAAYRTAGRLYDDRQGLEHDYSRKSGVIHSEIMVPENAPDWMRDRSQLWNAVEIIEKRRDAQLAREIEVSLPRELDRGQRLELLRGFIEREFVDRGMIADVAVHESKARDGFSQPHAHVMLTMRELTGDGFGKKDRGWNAPDLLLGWREAWARDANIALEHAGRSERIDHRSIDAQRSEAEQQVERARASGQEKLVFEYEKKVIELSREPEPKIGPSANAQEKRGIVTERGSAFRAAQARNAQREELGRKQLELRLELMERGRAFIASARERLDQLWNRAEAALYRIKERVIGGGGRLHADPEHSDFDTRREVVSGRDFKRSEEQTFNAVRERTAPENANQARRDAVLGRERETISIEQESIDRSQEQRESILGRGKSSDRRDPERSR